jgi:hypothetical protein
MQSTLQGTQARAVDTKEEKKYVDLLVHALTAPLIVWPGFEDDLLFREKKERVVLMRLAALARDKSYDSATDLEIALYMSSASLGSSGPLPQDAADVFMYATRHSGFEASFDADEMLKDEGKKLDYEAEALYDQLGRWIFKKQAEALKQRSKEEKIVEKVEAKSELLQATL